MNDKHISAKNLWDEPFHGIVLGQLCTHALAGQMARFVIVQTEQDQTIMWMCG